MKTPYLYLDEEKLSKNIDEIAQLAKANGTTLRPHCKSHKTIEIAKYQIEAGSKGITASTLKEVEMLLEGGIKDITLAYPLIGDDKILEYKRLLDKGNLRTIVTSFEHAQYLNKYFYDQPLVVYLKVDTGLNRLGIKKEEIDSTLSKLDDLNNLKVIGLLTHGGHSYQGKRSLEDIAHEEAFSLINNNKRELIVSCGSTPTIKELLKIEGVNEGRPGNYVFYDRTMIALGVTTIDKVSLFVISTIIDKKDDYLVIDAGSKTLSSDAGVHGNKNITGYGLIIENEDLIIERLSEEHGIVIGKGIDSFNIGDKITIIPNHACAVVNLFDEINVFSKGKYIKTYKVRGRGH